MENSSELPGVANFSRDREGASRVPLFDGNHPNLRTGNRALDFVFDPLRTFDHFPDRKRGIKLQQPFDEDLTARTARVNTIQSLVIPGSGGHRLLDAGLQQSTWPDGDRDCDYPRSFNENSFTKDEREFR